MCGIVGLWRRSGGSAARETIDRAADLLARRGPDDQGCWREGAVALGHRRLSIIDLSASGHQPMISRDGRYVITYNGEVYNFAEIRRELGVDQSIWQSNTDTEVVLEAYARWGEKCLSRFKGMFAFAIWDRHEERLFVARDRMGVKPLYYYLGVDSFAFASRPRALFSLLPGLSKDFDLQALRYYLEIGYIPAPLTIHTAIRKLPPAHFMRVSAEGVELERYWDFRQISVSASWVQRSEEELLDELDEIVQRNIRLRLIADVPLGVFLSGGIDSSLVAASMARESAKPVKTFTIGFDDGAYDESGHAAAVARHIGSDHHCEILRVDDLISLLPLFLEEFDEPFFDNSAFATLAVSRLARRHVTVSLSGDGGDELFGGYHYYGILRKLAPFFALPTSARSILARVFATMPSHQLKLLGGALGSTDLFAAFGFARSISKDFGGVLSAEIRTATRGIQDLFASAGQEFAPGLRAEERGMRLDALFTLPDDYLQKVDVASMAFSLESREPLLDHELVEWAMRLPVEWKLRKSTNKYLLRRLAYRYVPAAILDRPKQGFGVPVDRWLRGPLKAWADERLSNAPLLASIGLVKSAVSALWQQHQSGRRNAHPLLWAILMLLEFSTNHGGTIGRETKPV